MLVVSTPAARCDERQYEGPVLADQLLVSVPNVVEEISAAGFEAHVAEPADIQSARGRKFRAKTDRSDAHLLRVLLEDGELAESWVAPEPALELPERAELFQHGIALPEGRIRSVSTRASLETAELSTAARERVMIGYRMIAATDAIALPMVTELTLFGTHQPACEALADAHYGIGGLLATFIWSELGDCRRFHRSRRRLCRPTGDHLARTPPHDDH